MNGWMDGWMDGWMHFPFSWQQVSLRMLEIRRDHSTSVVDNLAISTDAIDASE